MIVRRSAQLMACPRCCGLVMVGLDSRAMALVATVDYLRLTPMGEVVALSTGRGTYGLWTTGNRLELDRRDQWRISKSPDQVVVMAEHVCGSRLPDGCVDPRRPLEPPPRAAEVTDEIPF